MVLGGVLLLFGSVFCAQMGSAVTFTVTMDTSALIGHPAGPFAIDFQLSDGNLTGDGNNTVVVSAFNFGGGSAVGSPTYWGLGTSGDLNTAVVLTDNTAPNPPPNPAGNEFLQNFTPGNYLSFLVSTAPITPDGLTPDVFSFSIYDSSGNPIPTTGLAYQFLDFNLDSDFPTINVYASDPSTPPLGGGPGINIGVPTISVPETSSVVLFALGGLLTVGYRCRRFLAHVTIL